MARKSAAKLIDYVYVGADGSIPIKAYDAESVQIESGRKQ
jgi:hypothetical protein